MQLIELSEEHESVFLPWIADLQKNDAKTFEASYKRKAGWDAKEFRKFAKESQKEKLDWRPGANKTSVTRYLMLGETGEIRAVGLMRFPLDEKTEVDGGNLIVDVLPSLRKKGYGSYCLALMLFEAVRAGLRRVLVTCPSSDRGARIMIERNRGVLQDVVASNNPHRKGQEIARYWINF